MLVAFISAILWVTIGASTMSELRTLTKLPSPHNELCTISTSDLTITKATNTHNRTHTKLRLHRRNALTNQDSLWPNGNIPFVLDTNMPAFTKVEILAAMMEIEMSTFSGGRPCILFVPRSTESDYIHISWTSATHGNTNIGRAGGRQDMSVNSAGGRGHDDNLDMLMTAIGLVPEVMRADRNNYLNINISNAVSTDPFRILTGQGTSTFGQKFDYNSVVLDSPYTYAQDRSWPVVSAIQPGQVIGQAVSLSSSDATLLQHAYHCAVDPSHVIHLLTDALVVCHFHNDICNFQQGTSGNFNWVVESGPTATVGTGPNADYSSGSGKFALAEARGHHNMMASMVTPQMSAGEYCLRINVFMYGRDVGRLHITVQFPDGSSADLLDQRGSLPEDTWYHIYPSFNAKVPFTVQIDATIGNGDQGDIAIDDVYMYNGKCFEWD